MSVGHRHVHRPPVLGLQAIGSEAKFLRLVEVLAALDVEARKCPQHIDQDERTILVPIEDLTGTLVGFDCRTAVATLLLAAAEGSEQVRDTVGLSLTGRLEPPERLPDQGDHFALLIVFHRTEADEFLDRRDDPVRGTVVVALPLDELLEQRARLAVVAEDDPEGHPDINEKRPDDRHCQSPCVRG